VVNLEDTQPVTENAAIGISVEARAENYNLTYTPFHGGREGILRETRSDGDEESHSSPGWVLLSLSSDGVGVLTKDAQGKWIGEDAALFQHLMCGTVSGCG
jgi:hypothetical protein